MLFINKRNLSLLAAATLFTGFVASCAAESKEAQCQKLKEALEKMEEKGSKFGELGQSGEPGDMRALADELSGLSGDIKGIGLSDETLKGAQGDLVTMFDEFANITREAADVVENAGSADPAALAELGPKFMDVFEKGANAAETITDYCGFEEAL